MFKTIKNALKTPEVRKKLLYTLLLIVIFRVGCYITIPGVDTFTLTEQMNNATNGVTGLIDTISGGAFSRLSIFAMSITPYITASIVIQLLGIAYKPLERLIKEGGEEGRKKINKYTKILTIILALIEGLGIFFNYKSTGIFLDTSFWGGFVTILSLMTGTAILMWLGEQITNKGIGNGISMLIFVGIIAGLPRGVTTVWNLIIETGTFSRTNQSFSFSCRSSCINYWSCIYTISRKKSSSTICKKSCRKKNGRSTKYSYTTKTCNGRSYANNLCFIICNIPSNVNTNNIKRYCNTTWLLGRSI